MNRLVFILFYLALCYQVRAQHLSGNITFQSDRDQPVKAEAVFLAEPVIIYVLSDSTNRPVLFQGWKADQVTGIRKARDADISLLQNPTSHLQIIAPHNLSFQVYSLTGKLVKQGTSYNLDQYHHTQASLLDLPAGMYLLRVLMRGQQYHFRLMVNPQVGNLVHQPAQPDLSTHNRGRVNNQEPNYRIKWQPGYGLIADSLDVIIADGMELEVPVDMLAPAYFTTNVNVTNADNGRAVLSIGGVDIDSVDFSNGNFSFSNISSDYDSENNVDDIDAKIILKSPSGLFEKKSIDAALTSDNPGENVYDYSTSVTPINQTKYADVYMVLKSANTGEKIINYDAFVNGIHFSVSDTLKVHDVALDSALEVSATENDFTPVDMPEFDKTLSGFQEGKNVLVYDVATQDWYANLVLNYTQGEGFKLESNGKSATSASNGVARINDVVKLDYRSDSKQIQAKHSKDGFKSETDTYHVEEGDNIFNKTLEEVVNENGTADAAFAARHGTLQVTFTDVKIWSLTDSANVNYQTNTGSDGAFIIYNIPIVGSSTKFGVEYQSTPQSNKDFLVTRDTFEIPANSMEWWETQVRQIPNFHDITVRAYELEDATRSGSGKTIFMYDRANDPDMQHQYLLETAVTNADGEVTFTVPGGTQVYFAIDAPGYYKKQNGVYRAPSVVDTQAEMDTILNIMAAHKLFYDDGSQVTADRMVNYVIGEHNTSFYHDKAGIYFPPAERRQDYIDRFNYVYGLLGHPDALKVFDTPFESPTAEEIQQYNPYPSSLNLLHGNVGFNISSYGGTTTSLQGKFLPNGTLIGFYANTFMLGGLDWAHTDHEGVGRFLGFASGSGFPTCRSATTPVPLDQSENDLLIMPYMLKLGVNHFVKTDTAGRPLEYNTVPDKNMGFKEGL